MVTVSYLVNVKELAGLLGGVTRNHIYAMDARGTLGPMAIRLGRRVLFDRDEVMAWVRSACPPRNEWQELKKAVG